VCDGTYVCTFAWTIAQVDRSCNIEKKMLLVLESLTTKVDSLVSRENDFKFLRNSVGPDWIK
jgi:hypothetical protein